MRVLKRSTGLCGIAILFACNAPNSPKKQNDTITKQATTPAETTGMDVLGTNPVGSPGVRINDILQDVKGNYWFATNGDGVYGYDGKTWKHYTAKDGLANDQVLGIQQDGAGNIWVGTGRFGVSRFDGKAFSTITAIDDFPSAKNLAKNWKIAPDDLWFPAGGGAYRYDGVALTYLPLPKAEGDNQYRQEPSNILGRYGVYCILKDSKGNLWFGTQGMGVCRYDGHTFTWLTKKHLAGPAMRALFEDRDGNMWFGNNGAGLFRYDGKLLTNFTQEKGLSSPEFLKTGLISAKAVPGTLARVFTINQDNKGDIWIGTLDAGAWRYDGKKLSNYTTKDGLASNAINVIYKNKKGELLFGTDGGGVSKFNGTSFSNLDF